jgi:NADH-quinone oxidoreductase subunit H
VEILGLLLKFLVFPGFLFSAVAGLLATFIDRKVSARLQYRSGPPWYQPFADLFKLLGKEIMVPSGSSLFNFLFWPAVGFAAATLVSGMLWFSFFGDLIVILYLLTIPSLALIMAGFAGNNPVAALGASREMKLILSYELPFILAIFTVVVKSKTLLLEGVAAFQGAHGLAVCCVSGLIAFLVALLCIQAKLGLIPFDIAEAEQELAGGIILEYSGAPLALFKLTKALLLFILPLFLIAIFWGGLATSSWQAIINIIWKYVLILVLIIVIKNTNPRLRIDQALRFFWGPAIVLAIAGLLLAMWGL